MKINQKTMTLYCTKEEEKVIDKALKICMSYDSKKEKWIDVYIPNMNYKEAMIALQFLTIKLANFEAYPESYGGLLDIKIVSDDELKDIDNVMVV